MVTISSGIGYVHDFNSVTGWSEVAGTAANGSFAVSNGDYFQLTNSGGAVNYAVVNDTDISISSTSYALARFRYKCSNAAIKAQIELEFSDASTQTILEETNSNAIWTVGTAVPTTAKTIDHVILYANGATGSVYYDFIMIYRGDFTLPNIGRLGGMHMDFAPREAIIDIPSKDGDATQCLGTKSVVVTIPGLDLTQGTWKRDDGAGADTIDGQMFLDMVHNRSNEPFQWLDTGDHQFKVSVHPEFHWDHIGDGTIRTCDLTLTEHTLADKSEETYIERWGINL